MGGKVEVVQHWPQTGNLRWYTGLHQHGKKSESRQLSHCHDQGLVEEWEAQALVGSCGQSSQVAHGRICTPC